MRVLEIPTPRWTTFDRKIFGVEFPVGAPAGILERAYSSLICYTSQRAGWRGFCPRKPLQEASSGSLSPEVSRRLPEPALECTAKIGGVVVTQQGRRGLDAEPRVAQVTNRQLGQ